jgi:hypothetical protein
MSETPAISTEGLVMINEEGNYWSNGVEVKCNLGNTRTLVICMCSDSELAKTIATAMNLLDDNKRRLELD